MTEPIRNWTIDINQPFSDLIQVNQFREACLAFHDLLVAAGWTMAQSFNGTAIQTSGTSNWTTTADVVFGTTGNGSWFVARSPTGWLPNNDQIDFLFYVNENLAGMDAQVALAIIAPKGYNTDGAASAQATGTIDWDSAGAGLKVVDNDSFVLGDGVNPAVTYRFTDGTTPVAETDTLRRIDISTPPGDDNAVRTLVNAVINATPTLAIVASNNASDGITDLTNLSGGTVGNVAITDGVTSGDVVFTGMSGGSNGSLPSADGAESGVISNGDDMIPWSAPVDGLYATWYTDRGDVMFGVKRRGQNFFTTFHMLYSNDDDIDQGGGGQGDHRWAYFATSTTATNCLDVSRWTSNSQWRGATPPGTSIYTTLQAAASCWATTSAWTNGVNNQGQIYDVPADLWVNSGTGLSPRYLGQLVDVYATPDNLLFGQLDDSERGQIQRRVAMGAGVAVYAPTADLPFL